MRGDLYLSPRGVPRISFDEDSDSVKVIGYGHILSPSGRGVLPVFPC